MVNGLHLYSAFLTFTGFYKALYFVSHSTFTLTHTVPLLIQRMQPLFLCHTH